MLEVGNGGMKPVEYRTHMSLWAMLAAPLLAGNDLSKMTPETLAILTNREVIAIDQDPAGKQGDRVTPKGRSRSGPSPLAAAQGGGHLQPRRPAVLRGGDVRPVGLKGAVKTRDVWAAKDLGS